MFASLPTQLPLTTVKADHPTRRKDHLNIIYCFLELMLAHFTCAVLPSKTMWWTMQSDGKVQAWYGKVWQGITKCKAWYARYGKVWQSMARYKVMPGYGKVWQGASMVCQGIAGYSKVQALHSPQTTQVLRAKPPTHHLTVKPRCRWAPAKN